MLAEAQGLAYRQTVHQPAACTMPARHSPLSIEHWVKDIGRRAAIMAQAAVRDREVAQDIVQDSLLAFISRYADKPALEWTPLFYTILRSQIMDWKRRQARRSKWLGWLKPADDDEEGDAFAQIATQVDIDPATLLANATDIELVQQVLAELPERQQQAFLLRIWEELDISTTARIMQCSESSVKTHYTRALQTMRSHLQQAHLPQERAS